jgi:hypothetical protein
MNRRYLGDSYDVVKRLWGELLLDVAPLYAEPGFIPEELRKDFSRLTRIPMLPPSVEERYSILNDPDTGIRPPGAKMEGRKHVLLDRIRRQVQQPRVVAVVTFDQSYHRGKTSNQEDQRRQKMGYLTGAGVFSFYYVSHAPFLFAFGSSEACLEVGERLEIAGIPRRRIERADLASVPSASSQHIAAP